MKKATLLFSFILFSFFSLTQSIHVGLFGGISNYGGDLVDKVYVAKFIKPAIGLTAAYEISDNLMLRGGLTYGRVTGDDKYNTKTYLRKRNLNFESYLLEASLTGEYSLLNLYVQKWTPYLFGGVALFHFNPYTTTISGQRVYLKPLSTEGQGLTQYPKTKPYSLTQVAIPFGGGFKYAVSDDVRLGFEVGLRKTFTDYIDDVSTNYADENDLLAQRGPVAVELAYRGDEVADGSPFYPAKGEQRGGAEQKDYYYFTGLTLSFRIGNPSRNSSFGNKGKILHCPTIRY